MDQSCGTSEGRRGDNPGCVFTRAVTVLGLEPKPWVLISSVGIGSMSFQARNHHNTSLL